MTDHTHLRKLATEALHWVPICDDPDCSCREAWKNYADAANPQAVIELLDENERLKKDAERLERVAKSMSDVIDNHCIAMQAALIESNEGDQRAALRWIFNTLSGPGLLPDFDAAKAMGGAQAWFDAKTAESEALKRTREI